MSRKHVVKVYSDVTPERRAHAQGALHDSWEKTKRPTSFRVITMRDWPLERLADKGRISHRQYLAGERFRVHWTRCNGSGAMASLDPTRVFSSDPTNRYGGYVPGHDRNCIIAAEAELKPVLFGIVVEIVCNHRNVTEMSVVVGELPNGHGVQKIHDLLKSGLDVLARMWGM